MSRTSCSSRKSRRTRTKAYYRAIPIVERLEERRLLSLPTAFTPVGYGGTGTAYWPAINPQNTNEIYLGSDMGEEWHTLDGGTTWTSLNANTQIHAQAGNSSVQYSYAADGKTAFAVDQGVIKKTTDGGATWTTCSGWTATTGYSATQVLADPNSSKLIVIENKWNYRSSGGSTWYYNVWFSANGGTSFTQINAASYLATMPDTNTTRGYLAGAFWDGTNIYLGTDAGLYTSTNSGTTWASSSISGINYANEGFLSFTGSRSGTTTRLYGITWAQSGFSGAYIPFLGSAFSDNYRGIYSVDIGQANWTSRAGTFWGAGSTYNFYPRQVAMADNNIGQIWVTGGDVNTYNSAIIYRSDDGGTTNNWTRLFKTGYLTWATADGAPNANIETQQVGTGSTRYDWGYGGDVATFYVDRANPNYMAWAAGDGTFITTDAGAHWHSLMAPESQLNGYGQLTQDHRAFSSTISETNVYDMVWADPQNMVAPSTDFTAMQSSDGGTSWISPTYTANTYTNTYYDAVYDWRTGIFYAISSNKHDLYQDHYEGNNDSWGGDYVVASYDKGVTWNNIHDFGVAGAVKAIALDPTRPGRLYIGIANSTSTIGGVWYSDNINTGSASTWTHMANQPTRAGGFSAQHIEELHVLTNGDLVAVFAPITDANGNAQENSGIWLLAGGNVSNTWLDRSGNLTTNGTNPNNRLPFWTMGVTIDPNDATQNTWFATTIVPGTGWYNYTAMYKSTDRGVTWNRWGYVNDTTAPYELPNNQVWKILIKPGTTEMFLAMKSTGLYYCADYTAATPVFQQTAFPFGTINNLAINPYNPDELWIATFGDGLYRVNIGTTASRPPAVTNLTAGFANGTFTLNWSDISGESGYHLQYTDNSRSGANNYLANWTTVNLAANTTTWSSSSVPSGSYFFRITGYNGSNVDAPVSNIAAAQNFPAIANVAAVGTGPTQAALTWTHNVVGETSFTIQKSTDGVNWTSAGTAPALATGGLISGLTANTQYYFRVRAETSNSQGAWSSSAIARTNSLTGLLAYEDFSYAPGKLPAGANQGAGWAAGWSYGLNDNPQVLTGSLSSSGASSLWTLNNRLSVAFGDAPTRNTSSPVGGSGTLWASYLLKVSYGQQTSTGGYITIDDVSFGVVWNGHFNVSDGSFYADSTSTATDGSTVFLVMQVISNTSTGHDTVNLYLNPTPDAGSPGTPIASSTNVTHKTGSSLVSLTHSYYATPNFDEIRIGTTYGSVAPIPLSAVPTNLTATPFSTTQINLAWTDAATNETGFHVLRSTDGLTYATVQTLGANAASWSDTSLSASTTYYYRVSSYNDTGDSIYAAASAATQGSIPAAPSSLSAAVASSSQINLTWTDNASNETGFKVYQSTNGTTFSLIQTINTANTAAYNVTGLAASTQYWFKVTAFNGSGESGYSNTVNATTQAASAAIASESFSYTAGALNGKGTAGSGWAGAWSANANPTVSTTSLTPSVGLATSGGSVTTTTGGYGGTRNLSSALNSNGSTVWSSVLITPDMAGANPNRTGGITIGNTNVYYLQEGDGTYRWEIYGADGAWYGSHWNQSTNPVAVSGTTYFIVIEQIFNGGSDTVYTWINPTPGSTAPSTASAFETKTAINAGGTLTTVKLNSTYYSNTAFDEIRIGTNYSTVAPTSATPPAAPSNLAASQGTSTIGITWTDNSGANETGFHIYRSTDNATWGSLYGSAAANATSFTDSSPAAGVGYYYKVYSYNAAGDSTTAATMSFAIATVIAYDGFNYTVGGGNNWSGQSGGVGFTNAWSVSNTTSSAVASGSLTYSTGGHALLQSGNSVSLYTEAQNATRTVNATFGTDDTSLWVGYMINQHIVGGTGSLLSTLNIGSDANNHIELGSAWNGFFDGEAYVGGTRLYWNGTGVAPTDGANTFLVYRIDFGHQAGNASPDKILLWVNPTPGTVPSDASATTTWTLPTGTYFAFTDSQIKLNASSYYNKTTYDEVRLGVSYISVAPDPLVPVNSSESRRPLLSPSHENMRSGASLSANAALPDLLGSVLSALPVKSATLDLTWHIATPDYHLQDDSTPSNVDLTLDPLAELLLNI